MTNKITINKATLKRWVENSSGSESFEQAWTSLVLESQRPELIERWAVVTVKGSNVCAVFETKEEAESQSKDYKRLDCRVVHLREVEGGE